MDGIICTISIGKNSLDDDYTFYSDGRIYHFYDQSQWKLNQEEWIGISDISEYERTRILDKCDAKHKDEIVNLFGNQD